MKCSLLLAVFAACFSCIFSQDPNLNALVAKVGPDSGLSALAQDPSLNALAANLTEQLEGIPGIPPINMSSVPSLDDGDRILREKCIKNAKNESYADDLMYAKEEMAVCIQSLINYTELQNEIEKAKPTGDLDLVFSKYCRKSPIFKSCVKNFTTALDPCLEPKEKQTKVVFLNVSESLLDFICFKEGDRIALFIAEGGPECLSDKKEAIQHCMNITMSKFAPKGEITGDNIPVLKLEREECTAIKEMHLCVVHELEKCSEITPSNIVDALMKFMMQQTPCNEFGLYPKKSSGVSLSSMTLVLTVCLALTLLW